MTEPTLDEAIEKLVMFAGEPDPFGWSLDGENFDLGALVVVVQSQVDAVKHEAWETKQRLKTAEAALDGERAAADELAHVANGLDLDVKRWRDQCPVTADHVKAAGVTYDHLDAFTSVHGFAPARWDTVGLKRRRGMSDVGWSRQCAYIGDSAAWPGNRRHLERSGEIANFVALASTELERPAHDILAEMAALEVPT